MKFLICTFQVFIASVSLAFEHPYLAVLESYKTHTKSELEKAVLQRRINLLIKRTKSISPTDDVNAIILKTVFGNADCGQSSPIVGFTGGGAGSGKSTALESLFNETGISEDDFAIVAPDEIMAVFPAYAQSEFICRATWFHEDSSEQALKSYSEALEKRCNTVCDGTMSNFDSSSSRIASASARDYWTVMAGITVPTAEAATRAAIRGEDKNRWLTLDALVNSHASYSKNFESYLPLLNVSYLLDNSGQNLQVVYNYSVVNRQQWDLFIDKKYDTPDNISQQLAVPVQREYLAVAACPSKIPVPGSQIWAYPTTGDIQSRPVVHQGAVFVGFYDQSLQALDISDGSVFWVKTMPAAVTSGLSLSPEGDVLYAGIGNYLTAVSTADGTILWESPLSNGVQYATPVAVQNKILSSDFMTGTVFALNAVDGSSNWKFPANNSGRQSPARSAGFSPDVIQGIAFVAQGGYVLAIAVDQGTIQWQSQNFTASQTVSVPVVTNTTLVFTSDTGIYAAELSNGNALWSVNISEPIQSLAIDNGVVFGGSSAGELHAFNILNGEILWTTKFSGAFLASGPTIHNGILYIGNQKNLYAVNAGTGEIIWSFPVSNGLIQTTPYVANGTVYVGSTGEGTLFAVAAGNKVPASTSSSCGDSTGNEIKCWIEDHPTWTGVMGAGVATAVGIIGVIARNLKRSNLPVFGELALNEK